jgi:hypothetical protein
MFLNKQKKKMVRAFQHICLAPGVAASWPLAKPGPDIAEHGYQVCKMPTKFCSQTL